LKLLVNPFAWYLLLQSVALCALLRWTNGRSRKMAAALSVLTLLLATFSLPLMRSGLEASLRVTPAADNAPAPALIFVLGGGYLPGPTPEQDVLVVESHERVMQGVRLWRRHHEARLVFSGAASDYADIRGVDRLVQLMAETARNHGVTAAAVILEPRSRNTWEHPVEALKLTGVQPATPVAVVTSEWHMPRAQREFCRHFESVHAYPVVRVPRSGSWQDIIPDAGSLAANTTLAREWVGMFWYAILGAGGPPSRC
jgi:uncharacterized SAM-binding protein YcdF (DUF218 family)